MCVKIGGTCGRIDETFVKTGAIFGKIVEIFAKIGKRSGMMSNPARLPDRLRRIVKIFDKTGAIFEKIIGIFGTIDKTDAKTAETCAMTWPVAEATGAKLSSMESRQELQLLPAFAFGATLAPRSPSITFALRRVQSHRPRWKPVGGS